MPDWNLFTGVAVLATVALLSLARTTEHALNPAPLADDAAVRTVDPGPRPLQSPDASTVALLANVALTHGLFGALLVAFAWYSQVPPAALGLVLTPAGVALGLGLGVGLYAAARFAERLADRLGYGSDDRLRALLAPETPAGWAVLLVVALPAVAGVEELLFRGALIGGLAAGYGLPVWGLAVASSVAFGLGHGLQGAGGVVVSGVLGFALAAAFVLTGSLWTVLVAHYLLNALEFVVHEGPFGG